MLSEVPCALCAQPDDPERLEYAPYSRCYCHRACVLAALAADPAPVLPLARELGLTRPAPGRPAAECPQGHPMRGPNLLLIHSQGRPVRYCRRCYLERQHAWRKTAPGVALATRRKEKNKQARWQQAHCPNGHEYTPATTLTGPHGNKRCRECQKMAGRLAAKARWGARAARQAASGVKSGPRALLTPNAPGGPP